MEFDLWNLMPNTTPVISILMPVKNTASFLDECLHSVVNQSFTQWELIAIDDHSSDGSLQILRSFGDRDQRFRVFKNTGKGIISALRQAFEYAKGQKITRMDSDDIMAPDKLLLMNQKLASSGPGHVAVGMVKYFSESDLGEGYSKYEQWLNALTLSEGNFAEIYKECSIPSPCWMVHREDLVLSGAFQSHAYPEDYDLAFRFKKAGLRVRSVDSILHYWRDYPLRTSRTHEHYADNRFIQLKVRHFIDQDYDVGLPLILWGAGKKGKQIASLLREIGIPFKWISNNNKKVGKNIYGQIILGQSCLSHLKNSQVVVALSGPGDLEEVASIKLKMEQHKFYHFF